MGVIIRECIIDDAKYIYELNRDEMGYDYSMEETKLKLKDLLNSDKDKIFVAVTDNIVVGYVHANDYDLTYLPHMKNIMGIAVSSGYKRKGIGSALIREVENWAKSSGAKGVRLVSGSSRTSAHDFYRQLGYVCGNQQLNFKKWL